MHTDPPDPLLVELADSMLERLPELARELAEIVSAAEPVLGDSAVVAAEDLYLTCRDNLAQAFRGLAAREPFDDTAPRENGRRRAEQGVPLATLLHSYRVGARFIWNALRGAADERGPRTREALLNHAETLWLGLDEFSEVVQGAYRDVVADQTLRTEREHNELVDALLSTGTTVWASADALGLPRQGWFCVLAAEPGALPGELAEALGGPVVWRRTAGEELGVLSVGRPALPEFDTRGRVGVSQPYDRIDRTADAARQARLALAAIEPGSRQWAAYGDRPLATMIAGAGGTALHLAHLVLAPLRALPERDRALLLDTAWAWCESGGSTGDTAAALYCHRNTVRHRLNRISELTGLSWDHPIQVAELVAAMRAIRLN
ncbi:helix-turn-helix domain-containing protein [Kutzneria viridogrisea]|uniref:PucR-like helix-turn-helix protein n=1 Tax=Kutzneria viridogrisea TaxID=47990 RepID=A0ABR6BU86_9PSEU|nr:hypothetical protein [Kutzneria viridogrisea]